MSFSFVVTNHIGTYFLGCNDLQNSPPHCKLWKDRGGLSNMFSLELAHSGFKTNT